MMKTFTRYVMVIAGIVVCLVAFKVLIMVPPEQLHRHSQQHDKDQDIVLWGQKDVAIARGVGDMGRGVVLPQGERSKGEEALKNYNVNVLASDLMSLTRRVPDSRPVECQNVQYPDNLPSIAIVIPFHNEWPSILMRTVYSLINRTPKHLLHQIVLVDDASDLESLKDDLDHFIREHFQSDLVTLIRIPERVGLIRARLEGFRLVTAEVVSFMDSHMEVNIDWLQPLLMEIKKDPKTIAMGHLDYILPDTFQYSFTPGYRSRYGFDWRLIFFETEFLKSQEQSRDITDPIPGVVMVGPGFVIRSDYFREMGMYDEGMKIWGGENLELPWRIWMCGGRLVHMACSKLGHIARSQPYTFPEGRYETELHNYKRAIEVWMGPYKKLVYEHHPKMKEIDVGDLTERKALRDRLHCKSFTWFLTNVWPELYPYGDNATHWGTVYNQKEGLCLDNKEYLFLGPAPLGAKDCTYQASTQSFSLTVDHKLRSVLQCVGVQGDGTDLVPVLITCHDEPYHTWTYTDSQQLRHDQTGQCLQLMAGPHLVMQKCRRGDLHQIWHFQNTGPPTSLADESEDDMHEVIPHPYIQQDERAKYPEEVLNHSEKPRSQAIGYPKQERVLVHGGAAQSGLFTEVPVAREDITLQVREGPKHVGPFKADPLLKRSTLFPREGPKNLSVKQGNPRGINKAVPIVPNRHVRDGGFGALQKMQIAASAAKRRNRPARRVVHHRKNNMPPVIDSNIQPLHIGGAKIITNPEVPKIARLGQGNKGKGRGKHKSTPGGPDFINRYP